MFKQYWKRCGLPFGQNDVFLNIAGGIKVTDPSIDLAVVAALISSLHDIHISKKVCFAGEVGLSGEIRPVSRGGTKNTGRHVWDLNLYSFQDINPKFYRRKL